MVSGSQARRDKGLLDHRRQGVPETFGALANPRSAGPQRYFVAERFAVLVFASFAECYRGPRRLEASETGKNLFREHESAGRRMRAKPVSVLAGIHSRFRSKHEARTICPSVQDSDFAKRACSFWQQKEESAIRKHDAAIRHNAIPGRQVCFRMSRPNYALQPSPVVSDRNLTFVLPVKYSQVTVRNSAALSTGRRRHGSRSVPRNRGALHRAT